jgi:membrane protease YdiL (CAAX protease family)
VAPRRPSSTLRLILFALGWVAITKIALDEGPFLLPRSFAETLSLQTFLMGAQVTTTVIGLAAAKVALAEPARDIGLAWPTGPQIALVVLAAPIVFTLACALEMAIALPTLLAEIRRAGAGVSRQDLGELGRVLREAPLWATILWAAVVAPLGEDLLFRGALWSAIQRITAARAPEEADALPESLPPEFIADAVAVRAARRAVAWLRAGGIATIATAAMFAAMHADVRGGAGIVRLVSAACLGLACGVARHATGTVAAATALHIVYNTLGVAQTRKWLVSDGLPSKLGMPTGIVVLAGACAVVLAGVGLARMRRRAAARPGGADGALQAPSGP